jgi:hypothetical protein
MSGHGSKIGRKMEEAITALLTCPNLAVAAETAGIAQSTLKRWMRDEIFDQRYREERDRLLDTAVNLLRAKSVESVNVLVSVQNDPLAPPAVRVSAARSIISLGMAGEMLEIEERLSELEELARDR